MYIIWTRILPRHHFQYEWNYFIKRMFVRCFFDVQSMITLNVKWNFSLKLQHQFKLCSCIDFVFDLSRSIDNIASKLVSNNKIQGKILVTCRRRYLGRGKEGENAKKQHFLNFYSNYLLTLANNYRPTIGRNMSTSITILFFKREASKCFVFDFPQVFSRIFFRFFLCLYAARRWKKRIWWIISHLSSAIRNDSLNMSFFNTSFHLFDTTHLSAMSAKQKRWERRRQ